MNRSPPQRMEPALSLLLAAATGLALCVTHGFAPALAPLAPVPLLIALSRSSPRVAFYAGGLCGALEAFILAGVAKAGLELFIALVLIYALFRALYGSLYASLAPSCGGLAVLLAPSLWTAAEWLHSRVPHSLPNLLGDTQHVGPLLPLARLGGTYLISFQLVLFAAALAWALAGAARASPASPASPASALSALSALSAPTAAVGLRRRLGPLAASVGLFLVLALAAAASTPPAEARITTTVVQGGIPPWLYERAERDAAWAPLPRAIYTQLTRAAAPAQLTIWPETAVWETFGRGEELDAALASLRRQSGGTLLLGLPRDDAGAIKNSAVALCEGAAPVAVDKRRLVVNVERGFAPGTTPAIMTIAIPSAAEARTPATTIAIGAVFCLESVIPDYAQELAALGAQAIVVLADGGRFGTTPVSRMHAQRSILRAVESGRAVVHAGQNGYTMLIDPDGRVQTTLPPFTPGGVHGDLVLRSAPTPFVRLGAWIVPGSLAVIFVAAALMLARRRRQR